MAYFAQLDENNIVLQVISINNSVVGEPELSFPQTEPFGQEFITTLGYDGVWKQTSFNGNFRGRFAGIGYTYDADADVFVRPQPFPSWSLDENHDWQPPVPRPEGLGYFWSEDDMAWVKAEPPAEPE